MITYETENYFILCPKYRIFSKKIVAEIRKLQQYLLQVSVLKSIAIDMSNIYSLSYDFFAMIDESKERIVLLNVSAEVLTILNLTGYDKKIRLFINTFDLEEDRRELRNRKFSIV